MNKIKYLICFTCALYSTLWFGIDKNYYLDRFPWDFPIANSNLLNIILIPRTMIINASNLITEVIQKEWLPCWEEDWNFLAAKDVFAGTDVNNKRYYADLLLLNYHIKGYDFFIVVSTADSLRVRIYRKIKKYVTPTDIVSELKMFFKLPEELNNEDNFKIFGLTNSCYFSYIDGGDKWAILYLSIDPDKLEIEITRKRNPQAFPGYPDRF